MSVVDLIRPELRQLRAYQAAEQVDNTIRLNANESPHSNGAAEFRRPLNRYPEVRPMRLTQRLAQRFGCSRDQLLVTRGSSEAIDLIVRAFCRAGIDSVLAPSPSFAMYRHYAAIQGAKFIPFATRAEDDFNIRIDALLSACQPATKVVFICSPNNPTGTPLLQDDLVKLLDERSQTSIVVVDEAYIEFDDRASAIEVLSQFPNLLVLRTLSKALGFAGARCGAVVGHPELIELLAAIQAPYSLATPVVECVEDALDEKFLQRSTAQVSEVIAERERLAAAIETLVCVDKLWPSSANFLLVRFDSGDAVARFCEQRQILLRNFGNELPDCLRITIGSIEENDALLQALRVYEETSS